MTLTDRKPNIQIKGIKEGLLVSIAEGEWAELQASLIEHIRENAGFFQGARVALEVGNHILHAAEMGALRDQLSENGISLWAVVSNSPLTEKTAQMLGLATRLSPPKPDRTIKPLNPPVDGESAIFVNRTLRSGFKVTFQGNVVVVGDVNPGAEVIASGSIVVWGRLRGVVHAGAEGNTKAIVCALDLSPMQLRIAEFVAVPPRRHGKPKPEIAHITNGQVVADPWES